MKKAVILIISLNFILVANLWGQDQIYTQFFNAPNLINPGFTGSALEFKASLNTRVQWPALDMAFINNAISFDYNMQNFNSGVGAMVVNDQFGDLSSTSFNLLYSYKININQQWVVAPGLQYGYVTRNFNQQNFLFGSEIIGNIDDQDYLQFGSPQRNYFDFSTGVIFFNSSYWFGFSAAHLNNPNVSILQNEDILDPRWSFHAGGKFELGTGMSRLRNKGAMPYVNPAIIYFRQGNFDQLDLGMQVFFEPMVFGAWYRGLAVTQEQAIQPNNSLALLLGVAYDRFEFAYSYDFLLSGLGGRSGGAHEISVSYQFKALNRNKKYKRGNRRKNAAPPFLRDKWWDVN